jgi:hypothetical protein
LFTEAARRFRRIAQRMPGFAKPALHANNLRDGVETLYLSFHVLTGH